MTKELELSIDELFVRLKNLNRILNNWTQDDSDLELPVQFEGTKYLSDLILERPKVVRENWFSRHAYSFTSALKREDYLSAHKILSDLKYFSHCFLEDSKEVRDTRTETLRFIAETIS